MEVCSISSLSSILNLMGTLYEHNIVIFPCLNLICDCILYMVILALKLCVTTTVFWDPVL